MSAQVVMIAAIVFAARFFSASAFLDVATGDQNVRAFDTKYELTHPTDKLQCKNLPPTSLRG